MASLGVRMRLCIVEDQREILDSLVVLLRGEPGVEVVGAHASAEEAMAKTDWRAVDILLSDLELPQRSGVELIKIAKDRNPSLNCMAYTVSEDRSTVFAAIKAGACGYILKGTSPRVLMESLRELYDGGAPMSPKIARKVILDVQSHGGPTAGAPVFSEREISILRLVERGHSYKEISAALHISPHTVHTHIKNIYERIQGANRSEVIRKARNFGIL